MEPLDARGARRSTLRVPGSKGKLSDVTATVSVMDLDVDGLSDDELRGQLMTWAGRVAAGEAVLLRLLGELDEREAWAQDGVLSCAHWAS